MEQRGCLSAAFPGPQTSGWGTLCLQGESSQIWKNSSLITPSPYCTLGFCHLYTHKPYFCVREGLSDLGSPGSENKLNKARSPWTIALPTPFQLSRKPISLKTVPCLWFKPLVWKVLKLHVVWKSQLKCISLKPCVHMLSDNLYFLYDWPIYILYPSFYWIICWKFLYIININLLFIIYVANMFS